MIHWGFLILAFIAGFALCWAMLPWEPLRKLPKMPRYEELARIIENKSAGEDQNPGTT